MAAPNRLSILISAALAIATPLLAGAMAWRLIDEEPRSGVGFVLLYWPSLLLDQLPARAAEAFTLSALPHRAAVLRRLPVAVPAREVAVAPDPLTVTVSAEDPAGADALALVAELSAALTALTGASGQSSFDVADVGVPRACFALARDAHGRALACGALRPLDGGVAEIKRMFARPGTRGVGSAVLCHLEEQAVRWGYAALRLSTRRVNERAVAFYERHGYRRIPGYGRYAGNGVSVCFEKVLPA